MNTNVPQEIRNVARCDFNSLQKHINTNQSNIVASIRTIRYNQLGNEVVATCSIDLSGSRKSQVEASIIYGYEGNQIYADRSIRDVAKNILSDVSLNTRITAADEDEFTFDDEFEDEELDDPLEEDLENPEEFSEDQEEFEDPEEDPSISVDNNIEGHYIVECDRCYGIFISALVESDQHVECISGICPLCQKESDQYIKWVVKPVDF